MEDITEEQERRYDYIPEGSSFRERNIFLLLLLLPIKFIPRKPGYCRTCAVHVSTETENGAG